MEPAEDAVRVLRHAHRLCRPGGLVLDLTSVPPPAFVEHHGVVLGSLDQAAFLERATVTEDAVELLIAEGLLVEEASLAHGVRKHFASAGELIEDTHRRPVTRVSPALVSVLERVEGPVVERSSCLLRRLRASVTT